MAIAFTRNTRVLFIGDSITDAGRFDDPEELGHGYVRLIWERMLARDAATAPIIVNRGISGNRVIDLAKRWDADVLALAPDVLSIKIGINDVWRQFDHLDRGVLIDEFKQVYDSLLSRTLAKLPACKVVLCEPTVLWPPASPGTLGQDLLKPYVAAVNELAESFAADAVVPLHGAFCDANEIRPDVNWTTDGCHPTPAGHMLIADQWLSAV